MPDFTSQMREAMSLPEANRELTQRVRRSNIRLGDGRIKVITVLLLLLLPRSHCSLHIVLHSDIIPTNTPSAWWHLINT